MALHHPSRSFTNLANAATSDGKNSTGSTLDPSFMPATGSWGQRNIWSSGSGGLSNGFAARAATRDTSRSQDVVPGLSTSGAGDIEGKTGSGSLVASSVSDDWNNDSQAARRNASSARSLSQAHYVHGTFPQQRSISNAALPQSLSGSKDAVPPLSSRAPTFNLSSASMAQSRPTFGSAFTSGHSGHISERPPPVYTKFDRVDSLQKKPDSAIGSWADAVGGPSPTDVRRPSFQHSYKNSNNVDRIRDRSEPRPRQAYEPSSAISALESARNNDQAMTTSRAPSSSSRNYIHSSHSNASVDQVSSSFGQLRMNNSGRPLTSFRPSQVSHGYLDQSLPVRFGSAPADSFACDSVDGADARDDVDQSTSSVGLDANVSTFSPDVAQNFGNLDYVNRLLQTPNSVDFRTTMPVANGTVQDRSYDFNSTPRSTSDWGNALTPHGRSPGLPDQQSYLDPRMQQILAAQFRSPYAQMYSPYALNPSFPNGPVQPYIPLLPIPLPAISLESCATDGPSGDGIQSALMYEFKSNTKSKRYELRDICNHIAEFAGDQHGSRFIQTKLETANSDEKEQVFHEIEPNALQLMKDVFGNYVIQKFFEHGDQRHKKLLADKMRGQVLTLSLQMYGCRVVQKALDHVFVDQQAALVRELQGHVLKCVKDQNGNHVVQKAIERCQAHTIGFIINDFQGQVQQLAVHQYGCRVIQRCLERFDTPHKSMIMVELIEGLRPMVSDAFGNYVVQHIVAKDEGQGRRKALQTVLHGLEIYCKHKFASNVVEKCLEHADDEWRRHVVIALADNGQRRADGESVLSGLIKDNYGNYVVQKLLDTLCAADYLTFVGVLQPAMTHAKRNGCGKQVLSIEKKMQRFPSFRNGTPNGGLYGSGPYQLHLPTPPFASHYGSAAGTPPPLTADTQSLQSSNLPSINGDAVEGAAPGSRKGSDPF